MAAGDLLTDVRWSHEVNGYTVGTASDPWNVLDAIGWVGDEVTTNIVAFDLVDGGEPGPSTLAPKVITLNLEFQAADDMTDEEAEAAAVLAAFDLKAAFGAGQVCELHAILPGLGHVHLVGVTAGAKESTVADIPWGSLVMQANFTATVPVVVIHP